MNNGKLMFVWMCSFFMYEMVCFVIYLCGGDGGSFLFIDIYLMI